jgi:hypothetical protein
MVGTDLAYVTLQRNCLIFARSIGTRAQLAGNRQLTQNPHVRAFFRFSHL